jgi:hypothetical protein
MVQLVALLLSATLFGGMVLYSFGFAPMVFSSLPAEHAGRFIRTAFPWYYLFVIVSSGLSAIALFFSNPWSALLMIGIASVGIFARQVLMPLINIASDNRSKGNAAAKAQFSRLHGASVGLNVIQLIAAGFVLSRFV